MELPVSVGSTISRINQSEDNWKAIFMAVWQYSGMIKDTFEKTNQWEKKIEFRLPASKNNHQHPYTPKQLYSILTSRDSGFTISHLQTIFSLFEDLLNESSNILCSVEIDTGKWQGIQKFFEENPGLTSQQDLKELKLAKETRNCYIHNSCKIDKRWIDAYKEAKGNPITSIGDNLEKGFPKSFHQIEEWNELVVNIASKIKTKIENKF